MPDRDDTRTPAEHADMSEKEVLYLLTGDDLPVWSVDDIGRAIGNQLDAIDAVGNLAAAGLIHQTSDGFIFATRAASRMVEMVGQVV